MKIAFLNHNDPLNVRSWSGTLFYMFQALARHCGEVVPLGPAGQKAYTASKIARRALSAFGFRIDPEHTTLLARAWARTFQQKLKHAGCEVIYAPVASTEIAFLETDLPIVYYSDITAELFLNYSESLMGLSAWSLKQTREVEGRALQRADKAVFSSQWAADSAIRLYALPEGKVSVVLMGANLESAPARDDILAARNRTRSGEWRLLFIAVDWERKGGDIALEAMRVLRARGINAHLTVVGCEPPPGACGPHVRVIPLLDKRVPEQRRQLEQLMLDSDFMIFPTRRDASPIVCAEANAFGLPLIAADLGGLAIQNGDNGILLRPGASGAEYADVIQKLMDAPARYLELALAGRRAYESRLNWDAWAKSMAGIFHNALHGNPAGPRPL